MQSTTPWCLNEVSMSKLYVLYVRRQPPYRLNRLCELTWTARGGANRAFNEARLILQAREKKGQTKEGIVWGAVQSVVGEETRESIRSFGFRNKRVSLFTSQSAANTIA
jgi:hypothetical protein